MSTSDGYAYFRRSSVSWIMVVMLSMGFYTWVVFWPDQVPYASLGPLGAISKHLVNEYYGVLYKGWWLAWVVHVFESLVALKLCSDKGINSPSTRLLWFIQTILFGFASLGLLLKYKPDGRSKRR
ncbi:transmembrane protein 254 [Electrophorus electricus]|uniref:Transmembrane protein 254 n=1 Tax=Electrophorus electricus TaxID=8005 RepID=A0AAY5EW04_ELEEL|nr:transmembrane protein 254 [Electrophorus electricus]